MKDEDLLIGTAIGYMLKVIKSQRPITKFKDEFNSIKHGNFYDFIKSIKEPIPEMVVYSKGVIEVNQKSMMKIPLHYLKLDHV